MQLGLTKEASKEASSHQHTCGPQNNSYNYTCEGGGAQKVAARGGVSRSGGWGDKGVSRSGELTKETDTATRIPADLRISRVVCDAEPTRDVATTSRPTTHRTAELAIMPSSRSDVASAAAAAAAATAGGGGGEGEGEGGADEQALVAALLEENQRLAHDLTALRHTNSPPFATLPPAVPQPPQLLQAPTLGPSDAAAFRRAALDLEILRCAERHAPLPHAPAPYFFYFFYGAGACGSGAWRCTTSGLKSGRRTSSTPP
jgi:hypothetical protein